MKTFLTSLAAVVLLPAVLRSEPENTIVLNLEPTREYPRASEGAFATLKSGRIIFCYSQFYGGHTDVNPARIAEIHSDDEGRTWSGPRVVVDNGGNLNVMSVSLLRLAGGRLAMFYCVKKNKLDCRPCMRTSEDEAESWSEPVPVVAAPPDSGTYGLCDDRAIQTGKGRIILPVDYYRTINASVDDLSSVDPHAIALWYYSDDEGRSWHESPTWRTISDPAGLQEPGVVELADGTLFSWMRTNTGSAYAASCPAEGGEPGKALAFGEPGITALVQPLAPAIIKRLPNSAGLLAVYNDHSGRFAFVRGRRTPLVAAVSEDGGKTWPLRKLIEGDPRGFYTHPSLHFGDGFILVAYCAGDDRIGFFSRLRIRRIALAWLMRVTQ